ncbi:class III extradiol dioxygenase subunit B-like domain-containing protein [Solwaraspora sp. WMMD937]|uniref:class III extradiol dioxygenase subunit B-like domain-containing protein n=1 Tax=Solwaraspora sp. WMMD937 TaxID=3016090 RepID=UPI00249A9DC4|nr:class III extradiol dioxygenase subunit B-like domain-containing protein [Solwaraspora sp. WMMD937]WFE19405.1 class III extradiol dioxygenase subunit B-like domain-containing protein [Solwaraspora sp. WMMD937]
MPPLRVAFCPHPPVIVPELAGGAAAELDELRRAATDAVRSLVDCPAERIVVIGTDDPSTDPDPTERVWRPPLSASFRPWGVAVDVPLGAALPGAAPDATPAPGTTSTGAGRRLPLSLTVAAWLLARADVDPARTAVEMVAVPAGTPPDQCLRRGRVLAGSAAAGLRTAARPWAALVMGDGSACRGLSSPGYQDDRAEPFDDEVAAALATADHRRLARLDPGLAGALRVAGRAAWQVAASAATAGAGAAAADADAAGAAAGDVTDWTGRLTYYAAPYGVAYFVASWHRN